MSKNNWSRKSEPAGESHDVARVVGVPISVERCARLAVSPRIRHHHIEFTFECTGQRAPASSVSGQSVEQNQLRLCYSGSQIVNADAICVEDLSGRDPRDLVRHGHDAPLARSVEPRRFPLLSDPVRATERRIIGTREADRQTEVTGDLPDQSALVDRA